MPGFFGAIGCSPQIASRLAREFALAWPATQIITAGAFTGGIHKSRGSADHRLSPGTIALIDGEQKASELPSSTRRAMNAAATQLAVCAGIVREVVASVAVVSGDGRTCTVAADWSGSFPLYVARVDGGFAFSTLLRPLARAFDAPVDLSGVAQFARNGFIVGGRTHYEGIDRLLAGQAIEYRSDTRQESRHECSRSWDSEGGGHADGSDRALNDVWSELTAALDPSVDDERLGIMMSAGWDSRTLLAAALHGRGGEQIVAYSHGDLRSRELRLVREVTEAAHVSVHLEPLADGMFAVPELESAFQRTESILFPHWNHAAHVLEGLGTRVVTSGVFGEVLGGHYGPAMLERRGGQGVAVALGVMGLRSPSAGAAEPADVDKLATLLMDRLQPRALWYAQSELAGHATEGGAMRSDVEISIQRLLARGLTKPAQVVEAFLAEHRGAHYINSQVLSLRSHVSVSLPFCRQTALAAAAALPLRSKIHNLANRRLLLRHAPYLLAHASAATLVPASAPIIAQEASRAARRVFERLMWFGHSRLPGVIDRPRFGWFNLEFLRRGHSLHAIADELRLPLWDTKRIKKRIADLQSGRETASPQALADTLLRVYAADLMCR